jgi:hypothetical protein
LAQLRRLGTADNGSKITNQTDKLKFVKEQFQRVFKANAGDFYDLNPTFAKSFKLPNGSLVANKDQFIDLTRTGNFWEQLNFVKIE